MRNLTVLWCLYDHVCAQANRLEDLSVNTSKQSMITATLVPKAALNSMGMVFRKSSQSGHFTKGCNLVYITSIILLRVLLTVALEMMKAKSVTARFNLNLSNTKMYC